MERLLKERSGSPPNFEVENIRVLKEKTSMLVVILVIRSRAVLM